MKLITGLGAAHVYIIPELRKLRQKGLEFKGSLEFI